MPASGQRPPKENRIVGNRTLDGGHPKAFGCDLLNGVGNNPSENRMNMSSKNVSEPIGAANRAAWSAFWGRWCGLDLRGCDPARMSDAGRSRAISKSYAIC